ncbi:MAG: hypothetical protein IRZ16_22515 [Myxococcaceae bacterium]|nr:hypothetical protein [Myxococcaceae bacterium]
MSTTSEGWTQTADGSTLGQPGPEGGVIARDESAARGVRLLVEEDPSRTFYSVTAMIADWMAHARFFDNRADADRAFEEMKPALMELAAKLPEVRPPPADPETWRNGALLSAFVTHFA